MSSDSSSEGMKRRVFLAGSGSMMVPLAGCAKVMETVEGKGEPREVTVDGDVKPPFKSFSARESTGSWYVLVIRLVDGAGRTSLDLSHSGVSNAEYDKTAERGERVVEAGLNENGPWEVTAVSNNRASSTVEVEIQQGDGILLGEEDE